MKLNWKANARETIKDISDPFRVSIHKFVDCGDNLYLSCPELNISQTSLNTESWNEAEEKAVQIIWDTANNLYADAAKLKSEYVRSK